MRAGAAWRTGGLALVLMIATAAAGEETAEVRVLSGPGATSAITIRATPDAIIEDRTTGARTTGGPKGPASTGETFTGELTLVLRPPVAPRAAAIEVNDPVVSAVRLFPEADATTVTVFVRQPVTYSVARPSALGEVRIELHAKTRAVTVAPSGPRGRLKVTRPTPTGEREVAVDAETLSYDQQSNTLTARGGVTLTRGDTTLTADEVVYDRTNRIAEARGHVVLTDPQARVDGDFAHLNLDDESGWIENADALLEPTHFRLGATKLEKLGGPRYSVANGVFTTCECGGLEKPSWTVVGKRTDVTLQGAGIMHGMTFRVKDTPVVYFPYFVFPANTQRQSGFLMPRLSYSNRRGFQYEQPFFWAISKSTDATIALDVETKARIGLINEYRYSLSREARGQFIVAYYNEQIRGQTRGTTAPGINPADIPENRFLLAGRHVSPFYDGSRFYLDLFAISDNEFLREINSFAFSTGHDLALRTTRYTTSRTGVVKTWDEGLVNGEFRYNQDLIDPQELALQRLPRLTAEHGMPLLGERVIGRVSGEAVNFQREQGYDGLRADLAPELFLPFRLGRALNGSLSGTLRETAYHLTDTDQVALSVSPGVKNFHVARGLPELDPDHTRELAEVQGRTGTEFDRVYTFRHLGLEKLKHTIEPEVQYLFVPQTSRPITSIPLCADLKNPKPGINCRPTAGLFAEGYLFDEVDAINRRNFFSYGVSTRLLGRAATPEETAATAATATEAEEPAKAPPSLDPDTIPQGMPVTAVPEMVGPPAPPTAPGTKPAPPPPPRELVRASILHGYDVSRPLVRDDHASDVDLGIKLSPVDYLGVFYNTTVNFQDSAVRGFNVGGIVREPWWAPASIVRNYQNPSTIGLFYRFVAKSVNRDVRPGSAEDVLFRSNGVNEVDGSFYLRLGDYLGFTFLSRYDLSTTDLGGGQTLGPHFLERDYLMRLISRCNCWVVEAGLADKTNPDERLFRVQVTLVGLGSYGKTPGVRNYVGLPALGQLGLHRPAALGGGLGGY